MKFKKDITIYNIALNLAQFAKTLSCIELNKALSKSIRIVIQDIAHELGDTNVEPFGILPKHKNNPLGIIGHELKNSSITTVFSDIEKKAAQAVYNLVIRLTGISNILQTNTIAVYPELSASPLKNKVHAGMSASQ